MIPPRERLEQMVAGTGSQQEPAYTTEELDALDGFRSLIDTMPEDDRWRFIQSLLRELWPDPLTYIRKTHTIRTKRVGERVLFKPNYAQERFWRDVVEPAQKANKPIRVIILKARQLGFSTLIQSIFYEWCDRDSTRTALTVSYDTESTLELFQKTRFVRRNQWCPRPDRRARGNKLELTNDSTFHAKTAGTDTVGRGDTYHFLHCSEIPMWVDAEEAFTSVMQSVPDQPGTCIILESTARGAVGSFYDEWCKAERGESDFTPFFAPWHWDPEYVRDFPSAGARRDFAAKLDLDERRLVERFSITLEQLHWRRWCIANKCQGSVNKFKQEYPSEAAEAFLTTGSPCFDPHAVAKLADNSRPPLWTGDIALLNPSDAGQPYTFEMNRAPSGSLRIWDHPRDDVAYVIGVDVAEGRVRDRALSNRRKLYSYSDKRPDYSAACVIELETGLHVASWHGTINPSEFAGIVYAMALAYNSALAIVEVNGPGIATVTSLAERLRYTNLYRTRQYAVMEHIGLAQQFGWRTLPQTREQLIGRLNEALGEGNLFTRDGPLVSELRTMERDSNGQPRAMNSNKDDRVFALALALQGRYDTIGGRHERFAVGQPKRSPDAWVWDRLAEIDRNLSQRHGSASLRSRGSFGRRDLGGSRLL